MPRLHVLRYLSSRGGEGKAAITFVIDKTAPREPAHHIRDCRSAQPEAGGKVGHAGITLLLDEFLDALEVIFRRFRTVHVRRLRTSACCHKAFLAMSRRHGEFFRKGPSAQGSFLIVSQGSVL